MEEYEMLEVGDLVYYDDPNDGFKKKECRVVYINSYKDVIKSGTIVTVMDTNGNAYDVYACELTYS